MESKHRQKWVKKPELNSFNRTSMESKRAREICLYRLSELLIEPVWNRNFFTMRAGEDQTYLLIEPVWNRNCYRLG